MNNGSYNSFLEQTGFCKLQSFATTSRETSMAPKMFLDGLVKFGVGLSDAQFKGSTSSCGRCIWVSNIQNFFSFEPSLTNWDYSRPITGPFMTMVMDQCTDPICTSGFLDFDIYNKKQPVAHGNPRDIKWRFIECPVGNSKIELMFCLGYTTCNKNDQKGRTTDEIINEMIKTRAWTVHVRGHRVAVIQVFVKIDDSDEVELRDEQGWKYDTAEIPIEKNSTFVFRIVSIEGNEVSHKMRWDDVNDHHPVKEYGDGIIIPTSVQV